MLLRLFQKQVLEQCTYILIAADELDDRISVGSYDDTFWRELQNFVVATANVSKLLWGQGGRFAEQREPLRDSIGVKRSSPLRPTTMRNHYEHIDERLDKWWAESGTRHHADRVIGPLTAIPVAGLQPIELFRRYDPSTGVARFWGDTYDLKQIVEEANRIYPLLRTETENPPW